MKPIEDKEAWRAAYRATTTALERIAAQELYRMTEEEALARLQSLTVSERPWRERRDWSGLVEQQAYFHGLGKKR